MIDAQLSKDADPRAVPEPHLSQRRRLRRRDDVAAPVRQAGEAADPGRERADRRARASAGRPVAVDQSRRRGRAQPRRAGADARGGVHHRRRRRRRAKHARLRIRPVSRARPTRAPATRRSSCASSSATSSAATIRPTGRCARRSCRSCRRSASGRSRDGLRRFGRPRAAGGAGGDRSARPATSWRWSAAATSAQSQFNRAARSRRQPGSAFKPLLYAAALEHGYSPVSVLEGLANIAPQGPDEWAPRNANGETPDALTLRAALLESNNRAATRAAAAARVASGAAARVGRRAAAICPTCRRCRSAPAWSRRST